MKLRCALALIVVTALLGGGAPAGAVDWSPWPMPVPSGGRYETPVGLPGDLTFYAPDRGLMSVGGNNAVAEGLYSWDGQSWHQLAVVCGSGGQARIAWAGPDEFWTIARPSLPRVPGTGLALCHFKDGAVVGSYSTPDGADDQYFPMLAAACDGPGDCWFGGIAAQDATGSRRGTFHLHWDGTRLQTVYGPQGRATSDLLFDRGRLFESTYVGATPGGPSSSALLRDPEVEPRLLHRIDGNGAFTNDPFVPATVPGVPSGSAELRALDGDGQTAWAVGGAVAIAGDAVRRPPIVARLTTGDAWQELPLTGDLDSPALRDVQVFTDVAAIPGTGAAWVAMTDANGGSGDGLQPRVVKINADGSVQRQDLAGDADPIRGAVSHVDCPAVNDCWLVTARGFLYRLNGAPTYPANGDPAFLGTITVRPNEAAEQAIPDDPPDDDSLTSAPPVELTPQTSAGTGAASCATVPSLLSRVRSKVHGVRRLRIVVSFRLARRATVGLTARRGTKVVARAPARRLAKGDRSLTLAVTRKRWPTRLSFVVRGGSTTTSSCSTSGSGADQNTVVTR